MPIWVLLSQDADSRDLERVCVGGSWAKLEQSAEAGSRCEMNRGSILRAVLSAEKTEHPGMLQILNKETDSQTEHLTQGKTKQKTPNQTQKKKTGNNLPLGSINKGVNYGSVTQEPSGNRRAQRPWGRG